MDPITKAILDNFAEKGKRYESAEVMGMKIWGAIVKGHQLGKNFPDIKSAEEDLKARADALDLDDPSLSPIEKAIKRLANQRFADAVTLIEYWVSQKTKNETQAISKNATNIANLRHAKDTQTIQEALEFYKLFRERYATKEEAAEDLAEKFPPIKQSTYRKYLKGL